MTGIRWLMAIVLGASLTADVSAQFFPVPQPFVGIPVIIPNGIDFSYRSKRLKIGGFIATGGGTAAILPVNPFGPIPTVAGPPFLYYSPAYPAYYAPYGTSFPPVIYGAVDTRTTLQIINPPGLVQPRQLLAPLAQDTSGIDLDEEPASKIWGKKPGGLKVAGVKEKEGPAKKPLIVKQEAKDEINPIKVQLGPDSQRQLESGMTAFRNGDYGIAILRFRQAAEADAPVPRALFLQGQAYIAVGKYREAVQVIQQGLKRLPDWHGSDFRPRTELYGKDAQLWKEHLHSLEDLQRQQPKNADYLFLLGYLTWFDGQRNAAVAYFKQARTHATDPHWADLFLQAAK